MTVEKALYSLGIASFLLVMTVEKKMTVKARNGLTEKRAKAFCPER